MKKKKLAEMCFKMLDGKTPVMCVQGAVQLRSDYRAVVVVLAGVP